MIINTKIDKKGKFPELKLLNLANTEVEIIIKPKHQKNNLNINDIELIAYDFDGVMTDNKVIVNQHGVESVSANRSDGLAVAFFSKLGLKQIIISTEPNSVVARRAEKIKIPYIHGVKNKLEILKKYLSDNKIDKEKVVFIGNDLNDKEVMEYIGIPIAPIDASSEILKIAKIVINKKGGNGVIRELYELLTQNK